jgi:hypothetical protein
MKYIQEEQKEYIKQVIQERHVPVTETGCWIWIASKATTGYGDFRAFGKHYTAHTASYMAYNGPIENNLHVMHKCDVKLCCNPNHLTVGTNLDNIMDSVQKNRRKGVSRNRPKTLNYVKTSIEQKQKAIDYMNAHNLTLTQASRMFNIARTTLNDYFKLVSCKY